MGFGCRSAIWVALQARREFKILNFARGDPSTKLSSVAKKPQDKNKKIKTAKKKKKQSYNKT